MEPLSPLAREPRVATAFDRGLSLALLTGTAYVAALSYQWGSADYLGIPVWAVYLSLVSVVSSLVNLFISLSGFLFMACAVVFIVDWRTALNRMIGLTLLHGILIAAAFFPMASPTGTLLLCASCGYVLGSVADYLVPEGKTPLLARSNRDPSIKSLAIPQGALSMLCLASLFLATSYSAGAADACRRTSFWVLEDTGQAILAVADHIVFLDAYDASGTLAGDIDILDLNTRQTSTRMVLRKIGPLRPHEPETGWLDLNKDSKVGKAVLSMLALTVGLSLSMAYPLLPRLVGRWGAGLSSRRQRKKGRTGPQRIPESGSSSVSQL